MNRGSRAAYVAFAFAALGQVAVYPIVSAPAAHAHQPVASPNHGIAKWSSPYADGTGDSAVGDLNAAQLNSNYTGPYYERGQPVPPAQAVTFPARSRAAAGKALPPGAALPPPTPLPVASPSALVHSGSHLPPPQPLAN